MSEVAQCKCYNGNIIIILKWMAYQRPEPTYLTYPTLYRHTARSKAKQNYRLLPLHALATCPYYS